MIDLDAFIPKYPVKGFPSSPLGIEIFRTTTYLNKEMFEEYVPYIDDLGTYLSLKSIKYHDGDFCLPDVLSILRNYKDYVYKLGYKYRKFSLPRSNAIVEFRLGDQGVYSLEFSILDGCNRVNVVCYGIIKNTNIDRLCSALANCVSMGMTDFVNFNFKISPRDIQELEMKLRDVVR